MSSKSVVVPIGRSSPWIHSKSFDLAFLIMPYFLTTMLAVIGSALYPDSRGIPYWVYLLIVLGVDIPHVYGSVFSTLFRPGFYRTELRQRPVRYLLTPACAWLACFALHMASPAYFWSALTYVVMHHFVRQQYGFMMLYARATGAPTKWSRRLDKLVVYAACLYPLFFWHCHLPRNFTWTIATAFIAPPAAWTPYLPQAEAIAFALYLAVVLSYFIKESALSWRVNAVNWPKNLIILGTLIAWYVGIVVLDQELAFTILNPLNHGIPYVALVWLVGRAESQPNGQTWWLKTLAALFKPRMFLFYFAAYWAFAYIETGLWDGLIYREQSTLFPWAQHLRTPLKPLTTSLVMATLAAPQAIHYVFDAFVWKVRPGEPDQWLQNIRSYKQQQHRELPANRPLLGEQGFAQPRQLDADELNIAGI